MSATKLDWRERLGPVSTLIIIWLLVAGLVGLAQLGTSSLQREALVMLVNLVIVVGFYVFIGNTGIFSFGQLAFMGIGGYAAGILVATASQKELLFPEMLSVLQNIHLAPVPATVAAGALAAIAALILCPPLMRLQGLNAALATFAVLIIVYVVANNLEVVTNGSPGLSGIPTVGVGFMLPAALVSIGVAWVYQQTAMCRRVRAVRDDEAAARSVGINPPVVRSIAFIVAAFIVGMGGAYYVLVQGAFQPSAFYLQPTLLAMAMLIVGGKNSLSGAVVGVLLLTVLSRVLGDLESGMSLGFASVELPTGVRDVGLALSMLIILITRPEGLMKGREFSAPWLAKALTPAPLDATETKGPNDKHEATK